MIHPRFLTRIYEIWAAAFNTKGKAAAAAYLRRALNDNTEDKAAMTAYYRKRTQPKGKSPILGQDTDNDEGA